MISMRAICIVLGVVVFGQPACAQVGGGSQNTPYDFTNSGGPWWMVVGGHSSAACSCYFDPTEITKVGHTDIWADDSVKWAEGGGTAGVSLDMNGIKVADAFGIRIPVPFHGDEYIGDINNYLEAWSDGACVPGDCTQSDPCSYQVSFTLDSSLGVERPIEFAVTNGGPDRHVQTLDKTDPNARVINVALILIPPCGGSLDGTITTDGGWAQPERTFKTARISCTGC